MTLPAASYFLRDGFASAASTPRWIALMVLIGQNAQVVRRRADDCGQPSASPQTENTDQRPLHRYRNAVGPCSYSTLSLVDDNLAAVRVQNYGKATDWRLGDFSPEARALLSETRHFLIQI